MTLRSRNTRFIIAFVFLFRTRKDGDSRQHRDKPDSPETYHLSDHPVQFGLWGMCPQDAQDGIQARARGKEWVIIGLGGVSDTFLGTFQGDSPETEPSTWPSNPVWTFRSVPHSPRPTLGVALIHVLAIMEWFTVHHVVDLKRSACLFFLN